MSNITNYKFQDLKVYQLALAFVDMTYVATQQLPKEEDFNIRSQWQRAATSVVLNIAEGSTGQSDAEQARFLGMALRSYIETIACLDIVERRGYLDSSLLSEIRNSGHVVFIKIQAMRNKLKSSSRSELCSARSPVPGLRSS